MVSINFPSPAYCEKVVMAAMKQHFKEQYGIRFVRRTNDVISLLNTVGVSNNSKVIHLCIYAVINELNKLLN